MEGNSKNMPILLDNMKLLRVNTLMNGASLGAVYHPLKNSSLRVVGAVIATFGVCQTVNYVQI